MENVNPESLLHDVYRCNYEMSPSKSHWITSLKDIFTIIGCQDIWNHGSDDFFGFSPRIINCLLKERFLAQWQNTINMQSLPDKKLRTYVKFKTKFEIES